jgi:aspartate/methionine/tyrosine aminotransferase
MDLARTAGVVAVPMDTFYLNGELGRHLVRFAFTLNTNQLKQAAQRLSGKSVPV